MEKIRRQDRECPLSATLGLVGEWWTLLILHDAFDGYTRFDEFQANLGISSSLLTSRLKRLVENGLLERRQYRSTRRASNTTSPTGRSLGPVIVVLAAWGNSHSTHQRAQHDPRRRPDPVPKRNRWSSTATPCDRSTVGPTSSRPGPPRASPSRDRYRGHPAIEDHNGTSIHEQCRMAADPRSCPPHPRG